MSRIRRLLLHATPLPQTGGGVLRDATAAGFETIVARVEGEDLVLVTGLHPFRGRFRASFTTGGLVVGKAYVVDYVEQWAIVPDLRSSSLEVKADKRKPAGIGVERLARLDGPVTMTALRAWIKKEA